MSKRLDSINEKHLPPFFLSLVAVYFYKLTGKRITCLQHLLNAEVGMLGGAIWSKMPPVALNMGMTSIKIATETSPKHNTSAFWTLKSIKRKLQGKEKGWKQGRGGLGIAKTVKNLILSSNYPRDKNQDASIKPALRNKRSTPA